MLRDKYTFSFKRTSAGMVAEKFKDEMSNKLASPLEFLCAYQLVKFMGKVWAYSRSTGLKDKKISLNRYEAMAFHVAYSIKYLDNDCPMLTEIYTEIDRSLNTVSKNNLIN